MSGGRAFTSGRQDGRYQADSGAVSDPRRSFTGIGIVQTRAGIFAWHGRDAGIGRTYRRRYRPDMSRTMISEADARQLGRGLQRLRRGGKSLKKMGRDDARTGPKCHGPQAFLFLTCNSLLLSRLCSSFSSAVALRTTRWRTHHSGDSDNVGELPWCSEVHESLKRLPA